LIPFNLSFVDDPQETHERERDKDLPEKLLEEKAGILSWLVRGCLEWQEKGLQPPEKVKAAVEEYKKEEDIVSLWVEEQCELTEGAQTNASKLYSNFEWWRDQAGYKGRFSQNKFGRRLLEISGVDKFKEGRVFYTGVRLGDDVMKHDY